MSEVNESYLGSRVVKSCAQCKLDFGVKASHAEIRFCCSRKCADARKSAAATVTKACRHCGVEIHVKASRAKHGRGFVCSKDCQYAKNRGVRVQREVRQCLGCEQDFHFATCRAKNRRGAGKYCSRACRDVHRVGANHPQHLNGSSAFKRGPNWQAQKRAAKRRDDHTCLECGVREEQLIEATGETLHVHHVKPYRHFTSYLAANRLRNLRTLCSPCHRRADAAIQAAERVLEAA